MDVLVKRYLDAVGIDAEFDGIEVGQGLHVAHGVYALKVRGSEKEPVVFTSSFFEWDSFTPTTLTMVEAIVRFRHDKRLRTQYFDLEDRDGEVTVVRLLETRQKAKAYQWFHRIHFWRTLREA